MLADPVAATALIVSNAAAPTEGFVALSDLDDVESFGDVTDEVLVPIFDPSSHPVT